VTFEIALLLGLIVVAVIFFSFEWVSADVVGLGLVLSLILTGQLRDLGRAEQIIFDDRGALVLLTACVLLCWVLISGHLGAPALGVAGSAWAATIASWCAFSVLAFSLWRGWGGAGRDHGKLGLSIAELLRMLRFGLPNGFNWFLEFAAFSLFINLIIGHLGTIPLAGFNIAMQINSVSCMPAFGMASAGAILVGQAVGRGARDEVGAIVKLTAKVATTWMVGIGILYFTIPHVLVGWFASPTVNGAALLEVGAAILAIASFWQFFDGLSMVVSEALRAVGDTTWTLWARVSLAWFVFLPVSLVTIFSFHGGIRAAMVCIVVYIAVLAIAIALRFVSGAWKRIDLIGDGTPPLV